MATANIKKIIRIGGSLAIILPSQWAKGRVKPGEEMVVVGNSELRIFPVTMEMAVRIRKAGSLYRSYWANLRSTFLVMGEVS